LATVAALQQFPGYFHLQNVLLHGEFIETAGGVALTADERRIPVLMGDARTRSGLVEVRGQLLDIGRLEPGDARLAGYPAANEFQPWPRPGEELVLTISAVAEAQLATTPSVRALALQPWRFEGQTVVMVGQFRGRNLFGDLPSAPGKSRYDFVLRSADAAIWVTDLRPRGRGFDLSVDARVDTGRWLEVTGVVSQERGLVTLVGSAVAPGTAPEAPTTDEATPAAAPEPGEVIFSSPTEGEVDVPLDARIRLQFSRGLDPASLAGQIRVTYQTAAADAPPVLDAAHSYDAGTRAVEIRLGRPFEPFQTIRVDVLGGIKTFDGGAVTPWTLTFRVGGQ
jgi:hypothetical protein